MTDDTFRGLAALDRPAEPDPAFAEQLFETLAIELGYRGQAARRATVVARPARVALRLAYVAAVVGLLAAALLGTLLVAGRLLGPADPTDLVRLSYAVYDDPPAFRMEVTNSELGRYLISTDGAGTWRVDELERGTVTPIRNEGSFTLFESGRVGIYDATLNMWDVQPEWTETSDGVVRPYPLQTEFAWMTVRLPTPTTGQSAAPIRERLECSTWELLGEATVADRAADHLVCRDRDQHFWLDRETSLVLALEAGPATPDWPAGYRIEAVSLTVGAPDLAAFSWDGPPGSFGSDNLPPVTRAVVGEVPPRWTGTLLDGGTFDTAALAGRPAALFFWATWCDPCVGHRLEEVIRMVEGFPEVTTITVAWDRESDLRPFAREALLTLPIVVDDTSQEQSLATAWGVTAIPALVLLDADGRVVAATLVTPDVEFRPLFGALAAGEPIPTAPRGE